MFLFCVNNIKAQDTKTQKIYNSKKWVHSIGLGNSMYKYSDFPKGQNEIDYRNAGGKDDQSIGGGYIIDAKIQRKFNKNYLGIAFNFYKDRKNSKGFYGTENDIEIDYEKVSDITIWDNQAYFNMGLNYEREVHRFFNKMAAVNLSFSSGISINRTPERLELGYYKGINYNSVDHPTVSTDVYGNQLKHSSTEFKNGFFVNPSFNLKMNTSKNTGFIFEFSWMYQWNKAVKNYYERGNYIGGYPGKSFTEKKYNVSGLQLRINYFF